MSAKDLSQPARRCPNCGAPLSGDSDQLDCARCLLDLALSSSPDFDSPKEGSPWFELPEDLPRSGEIVGHYELMNEIARGGMGVVYRARQAGSRRIVALKMILPHQRSTPEMMARFRAEAEIVAGLDHPNILPIYEISEFSGVPYFTMKLAENGSLMNQARKLRENFRGIATFMRKVALAVHYAHQRGVLHRDLKPANILLDQNFEPLVSDFGLARRLQDEPGITVTRAVLGTPNYLSPEQARGESIRLTTSSDLFSLGAILYELLVWYPPFTGEDPMKVVRQVSDTDPVKPSAIRIDIPSDLEVICLKCLEKEPHHRYSSALALANDLDRWLEGRSIAARPASHFERTCRWAKRNPFLAAASALLGLALTGIVFGSALFTINLDAARKRAEAAENSATAELRHAYLSQSRATRLTRMTGQRFDALEVIARAAKIRSGLDLRNEATAVLALSDLRLEREWKAKNTGIDALSFDHKLERYAVAEKPGYITIRRASDQTEIRRITYSGPPAIYLTPFSRDDRFIGIRHADSRWTFWDLSGGAEGPILELTRDPSGTQAKVFAFDADFNPASREVAVNLPDGNLAVFDLLTGRQKQEIAVPERGAAVAYNERGDLIAVSEPNRKVVAIFEASTGGLKLVVPCAAQIVSIAWSPFGDELACGDFDGTISFWDPRTGEHIASVEAANSQIVQLAYTRGGDYLVSNSFDRVLTLWDAKQHLSLSRITGWGSLPGMQLSDSGRLGCTAPELNAGIIQLSLKPAWRIFHHPRKPEGAGLFSALDFNRDGALLATAALDGVRLYDVKQGRLLTNLRVDAGAEKAMNEKSVRFVWKNDREALLISSRKSGLFEWPIKRVGERDLQIGSPVPVDLQPGFLMTGADRAATRVILTNNESGSIRILDRNPSDQVFERQERAGIFSSTLSPDGRWLASTMVNTRGSKDPFAQVWNVSSGQVVKRVEAGTGATASFDPSGRWLLLSGNTCRAFTVPDWRNGPPVSNEASIFGFSHRSTWLATTEGTRTKIYAFPEMREVVTLESPYGLAMPAGRLAFSPDDSKLAILAGDGSLQVWDLARLHEGLRRLGLDW